MTAGAALLTLRDVRLDFTFGSGLFGPGAKVSAVDGVSLSVAPGEAFGLVGESGSGKSSLAKAILNLHPPTSGSIEFEGRALGGCSPGEWRALRRRIQYVFQDPLAALDPRMRVIDQVKEALDIHAVGAPGGRRDRAFGELAAVGIDPETATKQPHALSGGQRQRAVIARALVLEPRLLICDEPVSALDVSIQAQVINLLADLRRDRGLTLLFISHDLSLVRHLCDRVAVMYLGRIVELAEVDALFDSPRHPYTRALIASIPRLDPPDEASPDVLSGEAPSLFDPPPGCRFHPRCPSVLAECGRESPMLSRRADGRLVACHAA